MGVVMFTDSFAIFGIDWMLGYIVLRIIPLVKFLDEIDKDFYDDLKEEITDAICTWIIFMIVYMFACTIVPPSVIRMFMIDLMIVEAIRALTFFIPIEVVHKMIAVLSTYLRSRGLDDQRIESEQSQNKRQKRE